MSLNMEQARQFFGSLYEQRENTRAPDLGAFEGAAIRLVVRTNTPETIQGKDVVPGDKALGILMLNHLMSAPEVEPSAKAALTAATLMNIKSEVVGRFTELFPNTNLEGLVSAARDAGYQVDILDPDIAAGVPRSVVGR
jgi:hypothetical protein